MSTYLCNHPLHWRLPLLVLLVTAAAVLSWRITQLAGPLKADPNLADRFFPENFVRMGATTDQTIQAIQTHLKEAPSDWGSYGQLGLAYLQKARETGDPAYYPKAEQAFSITLANNPGDYSSVAGMGALKLAQHQFKSALDWGERSRSVNPDHAFGYGVSADAQIELGQYPEAVQTLQEMVNLRPDMSSYSRVSYIRELYGNVDQAVEAMQMAADAGEPQLENTAWTRTQLGNLYFTQGNLQQAEFEYQFTLQGYPNYIYALAGLGHIRAAQGKYPEAIAYLTKASQKIPIPDFIIALGEVYQANGQSDAARREYNLVHVIQKLYQANGVDLDLEIALFNADHSFDPSGTVAQARQAYTRRPSIYGADVLAWSLYQNGQYLEAQKYSQQALRLGTKDALKLYHAGMISLKSGDSVKARQYLEQALAINPYFSLLYSGPAQQTLAGLKAAPVK
jgi:tetratricopeptide (TPR) repeat protein